MDVSWESWKEAREVGGCSPRDEGETRPSKESIAKMRQRLSVLGDVMCELRRKRGVVMASAILGR
jgi:hypothetical protein